MDTSLVVIAWGLAAIALNVGVGRWCRSRSPLETGVDGTVETEPSR